MASIVNPPGGRTFSAQPQYVPLSPIRRACLWIYIFAFCFDFKGDMGGSAAQYLYVGIAILAFVSFLLTGRPNRTYPGLRWITGYWWLYLAVTLITVFAGTITSTVQVVPDTYGRVIIPFVLLGISLIFCGQLEARGTDPREILTPLITAGFVTSLWHFFYGLKFGGGSGEGVIDINDMRYQILSPAAPFLIAYGLVGLLCSRRITAAPITALCVSAAIIILSVTRTFIITGIVCVAVLAIYMLRESKFAPDLGKRLLNRFMVLMAVGVVVIAIVLIIRPNTFDTWTGRIANNNGSVEDSTYLMRMAEVSWDWHAIRSNPQYLLTGRGIGALYNHDQSYQHLLGRGLTLLDSPMFYPADCTWSYAFFSGGLIFGTMMLGIFIIPIVHAVRSIYLRETKSDPHLAYIKLITVVSLIAYGSTINTSAPIGERMFGVLMGFLVGLAYWETKSPSTPPDLARTSKAHSRLS
jgi:hypothetical protein